MADPNAMKSKPGEFLLDQTWCQGVWDDMQQCDGGKVFEYIVAGIIDAHPSDAAGSRTGRIAQALFALLGRQQATGRKPIDDTDALLFMASEYVADRVDAQTSEYRRAAGLSRVGNARPRTIAALAREAALLVVPENKAQAETRLEERFSSRRDEIFKLYFATAGLGSKERSVASVILQMFAAMGLATNDRYVRPIPITDWTGFLDDPSRLE